MPPETASIPAPTDAWIWWLVGLTTYVGLAILWWTMLVPALRRGPGGTAPLGLLWRLSKAMLRWRQRPRFEGLEHFEAAMASGPVLVVANHTGAVDPVLVQTAGPRLIKWMMAKDMMGSGCEDLWALVRVIPVDRAGSDVASLLAAMRTLRRGGVVGVFPEGRITRPPGTIRPFQEGVGVLAARCGAIVLPCWVSQTPDADGMMGSLFGRSMSRVVFLEPTRYERSMSAAAVAADLRARLAAASGWPMCDEAMPLIVPP
jgi:1-acyl-sn-glycerol-3-phosphate acyltransferase